MPQRLFALALVCLLHGCDDKSEPTPSQPDASTPDAAPGADAPPALPTCGEPLGEPCASPTPAPTDPTAITGFVSNEAVSLHCSAEGQPTWDLSSLIDLYGDDRVFMLGEVHGTNEIGAMSARLLEELARRGLVNVVAFELPMDFDEAFQRYVDTGSDPLVDALMTQFADNFFGTVLPNRARELAQDSIPLRVGCVDSPYGTELAVHAIEALAAGLTDHRSMVLDTLPAPLSWMETATTAYQTSVYAYDNLIQSNLTAICAELDAAGCDRLSAMTTAMWTAVALFDPGIDINHWFSRREQVIYYNLRSKLPDPTDRMYLHMGAFHTNKFAESAGSRIAREHPPTMGRVFSVGPAWGEGSVIYYGGEMDVPPSPPVVAAALADGAADPIFISTSRPSAACIGNPLAPMIDEVAFGPMSETYDGYLHIRRLTPENRPDDATVRMLARPELARFWHIRDRITDLERRRRR